jgi:hypothetical protein
VKIVETGYRVKGRFLLNGAEGDPGKRPSYAVLDGVWPCNSDSSAGPNAKQWMRIFFDLGRLSIAPGARFESWNSITPGTYRLLGKIEGVSLDQQVEVPDPQGHDFSSLGNMLNAGETPIIDLGDVLVVQKQRTAAKQQ